MTTNEIRALLDERAIRDVVLRYCRAVDRRQMDVVRPDRGDLVITRNASGSRKA